MGKDAIAQLGHDVAVFQTYQEKQAAISLRPFVVAARNLWRGFRGAPAAAGMAGSMGRALGSRGAKIGAGAAGATLGALGAKDLGSAASGGWGGEGNLGWHKQNIQGRDFDASARGYFLPTAWGRTLMSPVKSFASMFAGEGPDSVLGPPQIAEGRMVADPNDPTKMTRQGATITYKRVFSPQIEAKHRRFQEVKKQYEAQRAAQMQAVEAARAGERGAWSRRFFGGTDDEAWRRQKINAAEGRLDTSNYGEGFLGWGPTAGENLSEMTKLQARLQGAGRLPGPVPSTPPAGAPGGMPPRPGAYRSDDSDWNYDVLPGGGQMP